MLKKFILMMTVFASSLTHAFNLEVRNNTSTKIYSNGSSWVSCQVIESKSMGIILDGKHKITFYTNSSCSQSIVEVSVDDKNGIDDMKIYSKDYFFSASRFKLVIDKPN